MASIRTQIRIYLWEIKVRGLTIIDWCCGSDKIQKRIQHKDCKIISVDNRTHCKPTIIADACVPIEIVQADMAFLIESLEHCENDSAVLGNVYNNLKVGGILIVSVPYKCKRHGRYPMKDYRRYSFEQIKYLLEQHLFTVLEYQELRDDEQNRIGYLLKVQK